MAKILVVNDHLLNLKLALPVLAQVGPPAVVDLGPAAGRGKNVEQLFALAPAQAVRRDQAGVNPPIA